MRKKILLLVFCLVTTAIAFSQKKNPEAQTVLWKISGKGLKKDSYLFGTLHIQDNRVFHFTDSMYHYLNKAEGFAMEADLHLIVDSLLSRLIGMNSNQNDDAPPAPPPMFTDTVLSPGESFIIDTAIAIDAKIVTDDREPMPGGRADYSPFSSGIPRGTNTKETMPTIMDVYLMGIAKRSNKWIGSVEDLGDQLKIFDQLSGLSGNYTTKGDTTSLADKIENLIQEYLKDNIQSLYESSKDLDQAFNLTERNHQISARMDSLIKIRSTFVAVGVAHLAGEQGIINLLRKKGYTVTPIISNNRISPTSIANQLPEPIWIKTIDGIESYEIEFPGASSRLTNEGVEMNYYFDLFNMQIYYTMGLPYFLDNDINYIVKNFIEKSGGKIISTKNINNKIPGQEVEMTLQGHLFKAHFLKGNNAVYILFTANGAGTESTTISKDVQHFFNSFRPLKRESEVDKLKWQTLSLPDKAIEVSFTGKANRSKKVEEQAEGSNWKFTAYEVYDEANAIYYLTNIRELRPGFHLTSDSSLFFSLSEGYASITKETTYESRTTVQGLPAEIKIGLGENDFYYGNITIIRGNRVYHTVIASQPEQRTRDLVAAFISRMKILPALPTPLSMQQSKSLSFKAKAPEPFKAQGVEGQPTNTHYVSFDANRVVTYEMFAEPVSPYEWSKSENDYLEKKAKEYLNNGESISSQTFGKNGKLTSLHMEINRPDNSIQKTLRVMSNKDSVYTLIRFSTIDDQKAGNEYFTSFELLQQTKTDLSQKKHDLMFKHLNSSDSATRRHALLYLNNTTFDSTDLPALHQAMLQTYPDDSSNHNSWHTRTLIAATVSMVNHTSSVPFIQHQYQQAKNKGISQYTLMYALSGLHTKEAYLLLGKLIADNPPTPVKNWEVRLDWYDSLELSRILYPHILKQVENPVLSDAILNLSRVLLLEEYIAPSDILPHKTAIAKVAKEKAVAISGSDFDGNSYPYFSTVYLLQHTEDTEMQALLPLFLTAQHTGVKMQSALLMLLNQQKLPDTIWNSVAKDVYYRRDLYDSLESRSRLDLFPKKWLSQELLAASDMYNYTYEDWGDCSLKLLQTKEVDLQDDVVRIFVYEISPKDSETRIIGITGPFSLIETNYGSGRFLMNYIEINEENKDIPLEELIQLLIEDAQEYAEN